MVNRPLTIIFDVFGTLMNIGDKKALYRFFLNYNAKDSTTIQENDIHSIQGDDDFNKISHYLGTSFSDDIVTQLQKILQEEIQSIHLYEDTLSTLQHLRAMGYRIALFSNLAAPYNNAISPLLPDLDAYLLSNEANAMQPENSIHHYVAEYLDDSENDILFIADALLANTEDYKKLGVSPRLLLRKQGQTLKHVLEDIW